MKNRRVLFLFHDENRHNGANRSMMDIIDYLAQNENIDPIIVFPKKFGTAIDYATSKGYKVYRLRYGRWDFPDCISGIKKFRYLLKWLIKLFATIPASIFLCSKIKKKKIDLIYTNTYTLFIGGWLKYITNKPLIWHIREFGKEDHNLKIICGDNVLYRYLNKFADRIIFISKSVMDKYIDHIDDKSKCSVLYNDISLENCDIISKWNFTNESINILIAGTIQKGKGQLEAVKAIKCLNNTYSNKRCKLYIAGKKTGEYYEEILRYIENEDLHDFVEFCGYIDDMKSLREKMHFGIVASTSEAFGRVTVEGMLQCMLMIGANTAGTSELILNEKTGYTYTLHNINELAATINKCVDNLDKSEIVAKEGYNFAIDNFTKNKTSKEVAKLIRQLC
ncbi:glycosyltransferase family 4 protein [Romboutsia sp. 1001713B170207_170306_H8]|uniref:glycosyltransferase family 4 protein n=1 Tax=Romboutsia sp. 1001713B170207_170306_H8 TaxID=2787112 RepID=UPI0008216579|nr:glycosyltransferase family 4 protein [Romboutsia sp. 1001713B170207_170306_H8]SCI44963.1 lipopolysaccharide 1%2C2-N-acetylglucosaminetransferase [uncultured Clostridium sp.]